MVTAHVPLDDLNELVVGLGTYDLPHSQLISFGAGAPSGTAPRGLNDRRTLESSDESRHVWLLSLISFGRSDLTPVPCLFEPCRWV